VRNNEQKTGYISTNPPKVVIPAEYDEHLTNNHGSKLFFLRKNNYYGIIDSTGKTIIPFLYSGIASFSPTLLIVMQFDSINQINKVGICNYQHEFLLPMIYSRSLVVLIM
jgi:hypothetical protein